MRETNRAHLRASVTSSCWPLNSPQTARMSLVRGMWPGSTVLNNLKRTLVILEVPGRNSACGRLGGFGAGGEIGLGNLKTV